MTIYVIDGIDPGLVDTGAVRLTFDTSAKSLRIESAVFNRLGEDMTQVVNWWKEVIPYQTFIEAYRTRSSFGGDARMFALVTDIKRSLPKSKTIQNFGVRKVIKQELMELLDLWKFDTKTNHQDLRSAARIALLGMVKEDELNKVLFDMVEANLAGHPWKIERK